MPTAEKKVFFGQFHFEPWVKISCLSQVFDAIGSSPWSRIEMTYEQLKDYSYLLPPQGDLAKEINGIPIVVYGDTSKENKSEVR